MSPVLSICIPTYNRSACLKQCLDSILDSAKGFDQEIEIRISDNASTDDTADMVRSLQTTCTSIHYHRNDANIGGDRNIYAVAAMGAGEYIWVFGDDDRMEPEAIGRVLEKIRAGYGLVVCNYSVWDKHFSLMKKKDGMHVGNDQSFEDRNELLKRFNLHFGYISSVVIKRDAFFKLSRDEYWTFIDYGFPFMYAIYAGIAQENCRAAYISDPVLCNRGDNSGPYDWYKYFVDGSSLIFEALLDKGYEKHAVSHAKHKVLEDFVAPNMRIMKSRSIRFQARVIALMFRHYRNDRLFWTVCVPAWLTPVSLIRLAKKVIRIRP